MIGKWESKQPRPEALPESAGLWVQGESGPQVRVIREVIEAGGLGRLTRKERRAITLRAGIVIVRDGSFLFDAPRTLREVARVMRLKISTVQTLVSRAAAKLREMCEERLHESV